MNEEPIQCWHGDCLELMNGIEEDTVQLIFADLPYLTTSAKWDKCAIEFAPLWEHVWRILKPDGVAVFTACQPFTSHLLLSQEKHFKHEMIWEKDKATNFMNADRQPLRAHESLLFFYKQQPPYYPQMEKGQPFYDKRKFVEKEIEVYRKGIKPSTQVNHGTRYPRSVFRCITDNDQNVKHPTRKPVALIEKVVRTHTVKGDLVVDPCAGSFSTGVACKGLNRRFIGIELDEKYHKAGVERLKKPVDIDMF